MHELPLLLVSGNIQNDTLSFAPNRRRTRRLPRVGPSLAKRFLISMISFDVAVIGSEYCFVAVQAYATISRIPRVHVLLSSNPSVLATDTPLSSEIAATPIDAMDERFVQARWLMPSIVEEALMNTKSALHVDPYELLGRLDMCSSDRTAALMALKENNAILSTSALTVDECSRARKFIDSQIQDDGMDNVDNCPDWQINVSEKKLAKIVGKKACERLYTIPSLLDDSAPISFTRVGIFLRLYRRDKRPWMPFHRDGNEWTVNVALNSDEDFLGGRLLALHDNQLQVLERKEGDATCHRGWVYHGVSAMQRGTRYSLILFFHV